MILGMARLSRVVHIVLTPGDEDGLWRTFGELHRRYTGYTRAERTRAERTRAERTRAERTRAERTRAERTRAERTRRLRLAAARIGA